jgi:hypothetical protein
LILNFILYVQLPLEYFGLCTLISIEKTYDQQFLSISCKVPVTSYYRKLTGNIQDVYRNTLTNLQETYRNYTGICTGNVREVYRKLTGSSALVFSSEWFIILSPPLFLHKRVLLYIIWCFLPCILTSSSHCKSVRVEQYPRIHYLPYLSLLLCVLENITNWCHMNSDERIVV